MREVYSGHRKMKFAVGLCFYNDLESLKRGLPTYADKVDHIFAIDGRYSLFDGDDYSTQETIDYLKSYPNVILDRFVGYEHDKRNRYLALCDKHKVDFLLIIDSDEYVEKGADWKTFKRNCIESAKNHPEENFFGVDYNYSPKMDEANYSPYPRLWARPSDVEYHTAHCIFKVKGNSPRRSSSSVPKIAGLTMCGDDDLRDVFYRNSVRKYQERMIEYEIPFRKNI